MCVNEIADERNWCQMNTKGNEVMFAGGVPGDSVEDVFRLLAGSVGDKALGYPDGEIDERAGWVVNLAHNTWPHVKGLEQLNPPVDKELDVEAGTSQFNHYTALEGVTELDLRGSFRTHVRRSSPMGSLPAS